MEKLKIGQKIYFKNVCGETYGTKIKDGILLKNGDLVPNEKIEFFINYISRKDKQCKTI